MTVFFVFLNSGTSFIYNYLRNISCVFRFSAKEFDVVSYLKESPLVPIEIFELGNYQQTILDSWITENPGFCVTASHADSTDFKGQLLDTTAFIHTNKQELIKLSYVPNIVSFVFDFGLETTLFQEDIWVDSFPRCIHALAVRSRNWNGDFILLSILR